MRYIITDSISVIILSNVRANDLNIRYTAFDILKILNSEDMDIDLSVNQSFLGKYNLPKEFVSRFKSSVIEIKEKDGHLILSIPNVTEKFLIPMTKGNYFFYGEAVDVEFKQDGKVVQINSPSLGKIVCVKN